MACLFLTALVTVSQAWSANAPAMMVGRVYSIEGDLLRYISEEKDWVAMVNDAPFGTEDALFSGNQGMAEMIVPNGTWLRVGNSTQIQFIALDSDMSEIDVATGVARFYNKGSETVIKATSTFGYVLAYPGTVFDLYVGENAVEVVAVKGTVSFIHAATDARYEVAADSPSILADTDQVSSGDGNLDPDWHRWNVARERFWAAKSRMTGRSIEYLPPSLQGESYALEENGRWESVSYEGSSRWFWRPTTVVRGWSPFTAGRWTDWNGDQVWIPAEPFGYVTHHYGNWIYTRNSWYWAPPVEHRRVGAPLLDIGFFWSPGRVSWIHHGSYVGWVPLAPRETYYSRHHWGDAHEMVVTNNINQININIENYAYAHQAIIVPQDNFYQVENYRQVRVTDMNATAIIGNYRAVPIVNNTLINNYTTNKRRHTFTNKAIREKPHISVIKRIEENTPVIQRAKKENADMVRRHVRNLEEGKIDRDGRVEAPIKTTVIVPTADVKRTKSELKLQQREIKTGGKPAKTDKHIVQPEGVAPQRPTQRNIQPAKAIESPRETTPKQAAESKPREVQPARRIVEEPQENRRPDTAVERPRVQSQEREMRAPPREDRPVRKIVEEPQENRRPDTAVEKQEQPRPERDQSEKQKQAPLTEEELEKLRLQKEHEEAKNNQKGKKGRQ